MLIQPHIVCKIVTVGIPEKWNSVKGGKTGYTETRW